MLADISGLVTMSPLILPRDNCPGSVEKAASKKLQRNNEKMLDKASLDKLLEGLQKVNLLEWNEKYPNPGIADGTVWSFEITANGETLRKHGDNSFPAEWDAFCRLISRTSGRRFR